MRTQAWPLLQSTAAATVAWVVAGGLIDGHDPFFAPIAAVVALNASGGERGTNAVRLLLGVVIGIVVGEAALTVLDGGYRTLAIATGVAMAIAVAAGVERIVIAQAAAGAILTVTTADGRVGTGRLADALIGAGVALVFSQVLFPVRVVALLRRTEAAALAEMVRMLDQTGRALDREGEVPAQEVVRLLGDLSAPLADLGRARANGHRAARRTVLRWGDRGPLLDEDEKIDRLILLGESSLSLVRATTAMSSTERRQLGPVVCEMAAALDALTTGLGDSADRLDAAERALRAAHPFVDRAAEDPLTTVAHVAVQMVATDIMLFAALEPDESR
ncbi:FUSC family protein [Actinomadura hibisca]|uniref:FUSC family protein n=1 Tax=Actinomadura hibisca TaxID=68565 RepID=UPI00082C38A3|nr:FUSC family protein [Actinomadura hibisca]